MAALTDEQKVRVRNAAERKAISSGQPVRWVKDALNAVTQAIADTLDGDTLLQRAEINPSGTGFPAVMSARIDAASQPYGISFTVAEKKWLFAFVCEVIFLRDG